MRVVFNIVAAAMLMASSFWFFTGFVVRGSSEGTNDTLDLIALALGLAAVIACRQCLGLVWWESQTRTSALGAAAVVVEEDNGLLPDRVKIFSITPLTAVCEI